MYQVLQRFLQEDLQERTPLTATRLVAHSTANPGATDEGHFRWLDSARQHGWAHYYLDWDSISQLVPEGFVGPANGPTANADSISFEMCEPAAGPNATAQFLQVWNRAVWLAADILHRYGWGIDRLFSHADISRLYPQDTDHQDPIAFLAQYGRTWDQFKSDVATALFGIGRLPTPAPWQDVLMDQMLQAGLLQQRRHPMQPVLWWELAAVALRLAPPKADSIERS